MVQAGTLFEYLAAFVTIVLGLALADLLVSLHRLLRERRRIIWGPFPLLLALFVFLALLTFFFSLWDLTRWESITYYGLLWQMVSAVPAFLAACAVLPDEVPHGQDHFDLNEFYFKERRYVLTLLAVGVIISVVEPTFTGWGRVLSNPMNFAEFYTINAAFLVIMGAMIWSERKSVHWISLAMLFGLACYGFADWKIGGAPAFVLRP